MSDDHFQVASKDGGESRTCQDPVSRCGQLASERPARTTEKARGDGRSLTAMQENPLTSAFHALGTSAVRSAKIPLAALGQSQVAYLTCQAASRAGVAAIVAELLIVCASSLHAEGEESEEGERAAQTRHVE